MGASYNWVVGLGNDQVGYIIPREHFVLAEVGAHELEADGDHYEETNSLGPDTAPLLLDAAAELIAWTP